MTVGQGRLNHVLSTQTNVDGNGYGMPHWGAARMTAKKKVDEDARGGAR
jgi:hypothetical protein